MPRKDKGLKAPATNASKPEAPKGPKPLPKRGRKPLFTVGNVEEALRMSGGLFTHAAAILKCAPNTVANYVERHPTLRAVLAEISEKTLDVCEAKLIKAISDENLTAIIFYLKCKGKRRGYVERQEVTGAGGGPIGVKFTPEDIAKMSDDDLDRLADGVEPTRDAAGNSKRPKADKASSPSR